MSHRRKYPVVGDRIDITWNNQYLQGEVTKVRSEFFEVALDTPREILYYERMQQKMGIPVDLNNLWIHKSTESGYSIIAYREDINAKFDEPEEIDDSQI